jgi:ribulose-bisphosphate carboxylase large chain
MSAILAHYELEAAEPERVAEQIAGELSTGTFVTLPAESAALRARHAARVAALKPISERRAGKVLARVTIAVPPNNVGASLIALTTTLAGNVFELAGVRQLRLLDFDLPDELAKQFPGPRFGVPGTRERCGLSGQPLIGTIIKPSVGLTPEETGRLAGQLASAGVDFIKDDELIADPPYSLRIERVERVRAAIAHAEDTLGQRVAYAPNISDEIDRMRRAQEHAAAVDTGAVMVCIHTVGLAGVLALRRDAVAPLHGHRAGWGLLARGGTSMGPAAHAQIWRLAGIDQLHVGGLQSKFFEADASVESSIGTCLTPGHHERVMPVLSAGQWGGQLHRTVEAARGPDVMCLAGGAIHGHPMGVAAGVRALRAAAAAATRGETVEQAAESVPELAASVEVFG